MLRLTVTKKQLHALGIEALPAICVTGQQIFKHRNIKLTRFQREMESYNSVKRKLRAAFLKSKWP